MVHSLTPVRRSEILQLARNIRVTFDPQDIEHVAARKNIILIRTRGPLHREAGFAYIENVKRPIYIESLAHPGMPLPVWGEEVGEILRSIVININSGVPECEIFWHEYYHIFYSPKSLQRSERFEHHFWAEGALHSQEERRADEFAAAVLIPSTGGCETILDIMKRFSVSGRIARCAVELYSYIFHE